MLDIMKSIYDMMGKYTYPTMQDDAPREHVESFFQVFYFLVTAHSQLFKTTKIILQWVNVVAVFFQKMDQNKDGVVTVEEFIESCKKVLRGSWALKDHCFLNQQDSGENDLKIKCQEKHRVSLFTVTYWVTSEFYI